MLYSQNAKFRAAFDVNGDGLGDNRDLFAMGDELVVAGAGQAVLDAYDSLLRKRGDFNTSGATNLADFETLLGNFGPATWLYDLNVDGTVNAADAQTFVVDINRSMAGDFNVDGRVDAADYTVWRDRVGGSGASLVADGDFDGDVDVADFGVWKAAFGFVREPVSPGFASVASVPEPATVISALVAIGWMSLVQRRHRINRGQNFELETSGTRIC